MPGSGFIRQNVTINIYAIVDRNIRILLKMIRTALITILVTLAILGYMGWSTYSENMQVNPSCLSVLGNVSFPSRTDTLSIAALHMPINDAEKTILLVYGLDNCKDDLRLVATESTYQSMGFSTLAIDMRSHGQSQDGGQLHGFGSLRANDVLGAFDWLVTQGVADGEIIVHGQSLGGSAALFAALREPRIAHVVAEGPILNFDEILRAGGSPNWFLPIFKATGWLRGFDLSQQPIDVCKLDRRDQKVFVSHVTGDPVTSISQLSYISSDQQTCVAKRVEGDWHIGWAVQQPDAFAAAIKGWMQKQ
jgi:pimeloyl-ACP methyl ester carboxylesterase